ncbi:NLR family CARD domain-containing protein 4-like [Antedon mediterranea]|uniref:NLR family CARD domain-containing protein 4-like n=1 Tax=Antedon mediterranea TaxID=105859 RepID=UPI003AF4BBC7
MTAVKFTNEEDLKVVLKILPDELKASENKVKFILSDYVPSSKDKDLFTIFQELIDRRIISPSKVDLLCELLKLVGREDLLARLPEAGNLKLISQYRRMLVDVGNHLEKHDCENISFVYINTHSVCTPWSLLLCMERKCVFEDRKQTLTSFETFLRNTGCNRAATFVKKYLGDDPEIIDSAVKTLSDRYCKFCKVVKPLPWDSRGGCMELKDIFINLNIVYEHEDYRADFSFPEYDMMFDPTRSENDNHYRVLIRGRAGTGKTTILQRMSLDWGESVHNNLSSKEDNSKSNVKYLKKFKLLFLLEIRKFKFGQSLFDAVHKQLLHGFSESDISVIEKYIKSDPSQAVFMLDGYDELTQNVGDYKCESKLLDVLRCDTFPKCHMVVTTRPHRSKDFKKIHMLYKHFELTGFTKENVEEFVKRYFTKHPESGEGLMKYIKDVNFVEGIAEIPIMTAIMCFLWKKRSANKSKSTDLPKTPSRLYQQLFDFLTHNYKHKTDGKDDTLCPKQVLCDVGKIGLRGLEVDTGGLIFSLKDKDDPQKIAIKGACEIGIMHTLREEEDPDDPFMMTEEVQFFHKSAQEKCAAIYLASLLEKDPTQFLKHLDMVKSVRKALDMHLLLKFTCAESYKAANLVLKKLGDIYKQYPQVTWETFYKGDLKIEEIKEMQQFLELCIGCYFEAEKYASKLACDMTTVFPEGRIRFTGISNYTAMSLAYLLKNTGFIRHLELLYLGVEDNTQIRALMDKIPSCRRSYTEKVTEISSSEGEKVKFVESFKQCIPEQSFLRKIPVEQMYGIYPMYETLTKWQAKEINLGIVFDGMTESVKSVTISGMQMKGPQFSAFVNMLNRLKTLDSLCLNSNDLQPKDLEDISVCVGEMSNLKVLTLSGNHVSEGFPSLIKHLEAGKLKMMEELWIENCELSADTLCDTIETFSNTPHMRVLDIRLNKIDNSVMKKLAENLHYLPRLEILNMTTNNVESEGYNPFFVALKQMKSLKRLHIADSTFPGPLLFYIATVMPYLLNLEYLHASGKNVENIKAIENGMFNGFIGNLSKLKELKELNLVIIRFKKEDFLALLKVCEEMPNLADLRLSFDLVPNGIDLNGLPKIINLC